MARCLDQELCNSRQPSVFRLTVARPLTILAAALIAASLNAAMPARGAEVLTPASIVQLAANKDQVSRSGLVWIPNTHRIVYSQVTSVSVGSWLYTIDVSSGATRKLVEGEDPVPSPDGRSLVFLRAAQTGNAPSNNYTGAFNLWIADSDGHNARQLTQTVRGNCGNLAWSPDSQRVAYIACAFQPTSASLGSPAPGEPTVVEYPIKQPLKSGWTYELRIVNVKSNQDQSVFSYGGEFGTTVAWLDNNTLLYEHDNGRPIDMTLRSSLYALELATGRSRTVLSGYNWQVYYRPTVSPDRNRLAFRGDPHQQVFYPGRTQIGIMSLNSGVVRMLPFTKESVGSAMSWAPDSKWLIYSDGPSTQSELIGTNGMVHRKLTFDNGGNRSPVFSSDGRYIAWIHDDGTGRTWLRVGNWRVSRITSIRTAAMLSDPFGGIAAGKTLVERWKSFDGTTIDGFLTLPPGAQHRPYPTIVIIHGGPTFHNSIDEPEWPGEIYFTEYLAQQGYAVFQPDYRGSGAFGYDISFGNRARRDPLREDYADIAAGIGALERQGIIDPHRLYIIGHSYGSAIVNWAIAHDTRFRAAVSYEGFDFFFSWSGKGGHNQQYEWDMGNSTPLTQPAAWAANSAVLNASRIRTPTLFINNEYGIYDGSIPWLAGALRSKGVDSQYIFYRGEPHVLLKPANQRDLIERVMRWIRSH